MSKMMAAVGERRLETAWGPGKRAIHLNTLEDINAAEELRVSFGLVIVGDLVISSDLPAWVNDPARLRWYITQINGRISTRAVQRRSGREFRSLDLKLLGPIQRPLRYS